MPSWARIVGVIAIASMSLTTTGRTEPGATAATADPCPRDSWIAGTVELCGGALVYRDYLYDDFGADDSPLGGGVSLVRTAGDQTYPSGAENTADLVDLVMRPNGDRLDVVFEVNALFRNDQTLAAVAIDTDDNPDTGGGRWNTGGHDLGVTSAGWDVLAVFDTGDAATNLITGSIPMPAGEQWRVHALTAQANGTVMNVAFRGVDEQSGFPGALDGGAWFEDRQAAALGSGDISEFGERVAVADLRAGVTRLAPNPTGFHQRVYTSQYTLPPGEGINVAGFPGRNSTSGDSGVCAQLFTHVGRYQPYGIYIPDKAGPHGLQLALHGCGANHTSLVNGPGMQLRFGEELNRVVIVPLGRGTQGYYSDFSERDVLDVIDDVFASYPIDEHQVFSGGYSMGGYGAYRFAELYPDRFAGMISWVGFTGDCSNNPVTGKPLFSCTTGAIGNVIDFVRNLRHVPSALLYAGEDELVHVTSHTAMALRFEQEAGPYEYFLYPVAEHLTLGLLDGWQIEAAYTAGLTRVERPGQVVFRTDESLGNETYGIRHDRAYWLHDIRGRAPGYIDLDVRSAGCGVPEPVYAPIIDAGVGPAVLPWVARGRRISGMQPVAARPAIDATLANVSSVTIDVAGACVPGELTYRVNSDGPVALLLSDGRRLDLAGGLSEGVVAAPAPAAGADPDRGPLPATGGDVSALGALALVAAGLSLRRRSRSHSRAVATCDTAPVSGSPDDGVDIRAVVCDDDPVVRATITSLVEARGGWVLAETDTSYEAINLIDRFEPNLVLLDMSLLGGSGLVVLDHLRAAHVNCQVVMFTAFWTDIQHLQAPGVRAVEKPNFDELDLALEAACQDLRREASGGDRRQAGRTLPPSSIRDVAGVDDATEFYRALSDAQPGDVLISIDTGEIDREYAARALRKVIRSQDRMTWRHDVLVILLVGAESATRAVIDRLRPDHPELAAGARARVIAPGVEPAAALDEVS